MSEEQIRKIVREEVARAMQLLSEELLRQVQQREQQAKRTYRAEPVRRSIWPWPFN